MLYETRAIIMISTLSLVASCEALSGAPGQGPEASLTSSIQKPECSWETVGGLVPAPDNACSPVPCAPNLGPSSDELDFYCSAADLLPTMWTCLPPGCGGLADKVYCKEINVELLLKQKPSEYCGTACSSTVANVFLMIGQSPMRIALTLDSKKRKNTWKRKGYFRFPWAVGTPVFVSVDTGKHLCQGMDDALDDTWFDDLLESKWMDCLTGDQQLIMEVEVEINRC
jgi:hypothetical protein